ncbi:zinc-dependent alcohol dehydrogenase family protein [Aeromicrobium sp. YIM 150415]|nr:zinc-dependent alcohol dehydrogenase family protein [Aeromicrobium sp. YIM 150415]
MTATTINPSDLVTLAGAYGSRTSFPFVPGFEGVGVISRTGAGVPERIVGDRVLPIGSPGAWQQTKRTAPAWCVPVPDDIDDATACAAYINPLTAMLMVERFAGEGARQVIVDAATSVIGGHLAELLALRGLSPVALTRGTPGRTVADPSLWRGVVSTSEPRWRERALDLLGAAPDLVFDCVGGEQGSELARLLAPGGVLVHYGLLSGVPLDPTVFAGTRVEMFRLRDVIHAAERPPLDELFAPVFTHLRAGRLRTRISGRHDLGELPGLTLGGGGKHLITLRD